MTAASPAEPDRAAPLSAREEQVLARIGDDLCANDPALAESMTQNGWTQIRLVPSVRLNAGGVRTVALVTSAPAAALMPWSWWPTVGLLLIALLVVPYLSLGTIARGCSK